MEGFTRLHHATAHDVAEHGLGSVEECTARALAEVREHHDAEYTAPAEVTAQQAHDAVMGVLHDAREAATRAAAFDRESAGSESDREDWTGGPAERPTEMHARGHRRRGSGMEMSGGGSISSATDRRSATGSQGSAPAPAPAPRYGEITDSMSTSLSYSIAGTLMDKVGGMTQEMRNIPSDSGTKPGMFKKAGMWVAVEVVAIVSTVVAAAELIVRAAIKAVAMVLGFVLTSVHKNEVANESWRAAWVALKTSAVTIVTNLWCKAEILPEGGIINSARTAARA